MARRDFNLDEETWHRLECNDPSVVGVQITADNWIEGAGRIIGNSMFLKDILIKIRSRAELGNNQWNWLKELVQGLAHNRSISVLELWGDDDMEPADRVILDMDVFQILAPFFEHNSCLRSVDVCWLDLSQMFTSLVSALSKCKQLERIFMENINCSEDQAATLFDALGCHDLVEMSFNYNAIGRRGCLSLANLIRNSTAGVPNLCLFGTSLDDDCLDIISNALTYLGDSSAGRRLYLGDNESITLAGWRRLSVCLRNVSRLYLEQCNLDDEGARAILMDLAGNSCLKSLELDSNDAITDMIWKDIARVLCDKTSIGSIYSSNHTLQELNIPHLAFPEEVVSLLAMNRNEDKSEVARQKILKHHFLAQGNNANVFSRMPEMMMPYAMEWIGRNRLGLSLMYNVVRDNPTLFDN